MTAQLINAADGFHLWSERYDRTMDDVFEVQDDIARSVVEKLKVKLLRGPESLVKSQENLEAYQWFLRGRHVVVRGTPESYAQAMEYFDNALSGATRLRGGARRQSLGLRVAVDGGLSGSARGHDAAGQGGGASVAADR